MVAMVDFDLTGLHDEHTIRAGVPPPLSELCDGLRRLLAALQSVGYLASFKLDDTDVDDALWRRADDLSPTRLVVTLGEPASLGAALQLNGGRVAPGLAAPVLAAYLRSCGARLKTQEEYFIDDTYRPNPLEYRPNAVVLELTVAP